MRSVGFRVRSVGSVVVCSGVWENLGRAVGFRVRSVGAVVVRSGV